jgi:riboflavin synthase
MFTGLVQAVGTVVSVEPNAAGARLVVDASGWGYRPGHGESIAVNGCCLTHAPEKGVRPHFLAFDMVHQTLARTTLGRLAPGDAVNLESCLTLSSPIGGHLVQGHIDGVGKVREVSTAAGHRVIIEAEPGVMKYIVATGSVAVDGVSLTVAAVDADAGCFSVALIPTTLQLTTLGRRRAGHRVNIETDTLVRTVMHYLDRLVADKGLVSR